MHDDTNVNGRHSGTVRVRAVWLDAGVRGSSAPNAADDQLDENQLPTSVGVDADETLEDSDESGGFVGAGDQNEGGCVDDDQLDGSDDDSPELDDDANVDAHPQHPERDGRGRFNGRRPGPGRPRGCSNYKTLRALELRQRIIASWDRVNGDRLLDQLAKTDPLEYVKLVVKLLPTERREPGVEQRRLILNIMPLGAVPRREPIERRVLPPVDPAGGG